MRLNKSSFLLEQLLNPSKYNLTEQKITDYLEKIISMGAIQLIYKNCNK